MRTKAELQKKLHTYIKRREKLWGTAGNLTQQIRAIRHNLSVKQAEEDNFRNIRKGIEKFFGQNISDCDNRVYRDFFYKFSLENDCKLNYIANYMKCDNDKRHIEYRRTRCLLHFKKEENKQLWEDLKVFMKKYLA